MSKSEDIKIKAGNRRYSEKSIVDDVERINEYENLADELGIFRLASVHRDLDLAKPLSSDNPRKSKINTVLVNLRIKFITKTDVEVEHVIPVMVTQGDEQKALTCYSGSKVNEKEFLKFYQSIKPEVTEIDRRSHYHSEPFLAYYLCSDDGKDFLLREFEKKGLIAVGDDEETYESSVKEVVSIGMDLHSTKVVCYHCGPFLKAATPKLLKSINWALVLPKDKRPKAIEFNVSANQNFDCNNISRADTFDHIPVSESKDKNILTNTEEYILTNTEESLGVSRVRLQKVGEASNRTYFLSGSNSVNSDVIALRDLDEKRWQIVATAASIEIQRMWREFSKRKKFKQEQVESKKGELREVIEKIDEKDGEAENLRKEIDALKARLDLVLEINDLSQRIEDLYERATENDLFEETENSSYDSSSKLNFLLELQRSEKSLKKQKGSAESNIYDLEGELEKLNEKQEILEQQIKDLSSVVPSKKSAGTNVTKKSTQKVSAVADHEEDDLDIFNYVGESSNLTHQNVLHLIGEAFELSGVDASQTAVAVISEDDSLDHCLRDEILKFIGKDTAQDRISIALCRGHLNEASGQIEGNTHWTALHLRRIENEDGTISIKPYYMDSMGGDTPKAVTRVLDSIKEATFNKCKILKKPTKQVDGYSCGYHAVFNMIRMHNLNRVANATGYRVTYEDHITQDEEEVAIEQFISSSKVNLQNHFNSAIGGRLREHDKFGADMDLNRALSESILVSDDSDLDRLKKLIQLEKEIKKSEKDPAIVLSSLNLEKFYKKLLSQCVEQIRYKFLTTEEYEVGDEDDVQKREQILEKLSSSKTAQNPQEFLEILERIVADPTLLSSSLDALLEDIGEVEKEQSPEDSLIKSMAKASLETNSPSSSTAKAKTKQLAASVEVTKKITGK